MLQPNIYIYIYIIGGISIEHQKTFAYLLYLGDDMPPHLFFEDYNKPFLGSRIPILTKLYYEGELKNPWLDLVWIFC